VLGIVAPLGRSSKGEKREDPDTLRGTQRASKHQGHGATKGDKEGRARGRSKRRKTREEGGRNNVIKNRTISGKKKKKKVEKRGPRSSLFLGKVVGKERG